MENNMPVTSQRMIVCSDCGNKRCPKASNHRHKCTGSNEVGQLGSVYTHPHKELSDEEIMKHFSEYWNHIGQIQIDEDFLLIAIRAIIKASRGEE